MNKEKLGEIIDQALDQVLTALYGRIMIRLEFLKTFKSEKAKERVSELARVIQYIDDLYLEYIEEMKKELDTQKEYK